MARSWCWPRTPATAWASCERWRRASTSRGGLRLGGLRPGAAGRHGRRSADRARPRARRRRLVTAAPGLVPATVLGGTRSGYCSPVSPTRCSVSALLEGLGVGEEGLLKLARPARRPGGVALQSHGLQPPALTEVVQREEPGLGPRQGGSEEPRPAHLLEPAGPYPRAASGARRRAPTSQSRRTSSLPPAPDRRTSASSRFRRAIASGPRPSGARTRP
jgi:hypothetical protein